MAPLKQMSFFFVLGWLTIWKSGFSEITGFEFFKQIFRRVASASLNHKGWSTARSQLLSEPQRMQYHLAAASLTSWVYLRCPSKRSLLMKLSNPLRTSKNLQSLCSRERFRAQCSHFGSEAISIVLPRCNAATARPVRSGKYSEIIRRNNVT